MINKWVNPEQQKIESEKTDGPDECLYVLEQVGKKRFVSASQDSNRWVNPPKEIKSENEFPPQEPVTHVPLYPFGHYTRQTGKKKPSKKLKKDRVSEKSLLLSDRLLNKIPK